jgi:hypothetical protein
VFRLGPEVTNSVRKFLVSRGWKESPESVKTPQSVAANKAAAAAAASKGGGAANKGKHSLTGPSSSFQAAALDSLSILNSSSPWYGKKDRQSMHATPLENKEIRRSLPLVTLRNLFWRDQPYPPALHRCVKASQWINHLQGTQPICRKVSVCVQRRGSLRCCGDFVAFVDCTH